jgi:hypothetical protein
MCSSSAAAAASLPLASWPVAIASPGWTSLPCRSSAPVSFDAVVALFVFGHVPIEEQASLITRIGLWLRDGGFFLGTFGAGAAGEEIAVDWLGAPMFFASLGSEAYPPLLRDAGLEPLRDEVVEQHEPGHGDVSFRWILSRAAV